MKRNPIRKAVLCGAVLFCMTMGMALSGEAIVGYPDGKMILAQEPQTTSDYMEFYRNGQSVPLQEMSWVEDGVHGTAVELDGQSEYLCVNYSQMQMPQMTFSAWVYWLDDGASQYGQRLFTMYRNEDNFLTVSLRQKVDFAGIDNGRSYGYDGIYMEYCLGGAEGLRRVCANPVYQGENYTVPCREWHHYTVTMDGRELRLYVDGALWFSTELWLGVADMQAYELLVGGSIWGDPTLHARLDDTAMWDTALSAEQVALLAAGADLSFQSPSETPAPYLPTEPLETTPTSEAHTATVWETLISLRAGFPLWTWILLGLYGLLFVIATVLVNVRASRQSKTERRNDP